MSFTRIMRQRNYKITFLIFLCGSLYCGISILQSVMKSGTPDFHAVDEIHFHLSISNERNPLEYDIEQSVIEENLEVLKPGIKFHENIELLQHDNFVNEIHDSKQESVKDMFEGENIIGNDYIHDKKSKNDLPERHEGEYVLDYLEEIILSDEELENHNPENQKYIVTTKMPHSNSSQKKLPEVVHNSVNESQNSERITDQPKDLKVPDDDLLGRSPKILEHNHTLDDKNIKSNITKTVPSHESTKEMKIFKIENKSKNSNSELKIPTIKTQELNIKNGTNFQRINDNNSNNNIGTTDLSLRLENINRKPKYIIWTRWRSGSSFLGHLLTSLNQKTFYSFEPLYNYGDRIFTPADQSEAVKVIEFVKDLLHCNILKNRKQFQAMYGDQPSLFVNPNPIVAQFCQPLNLCRDLELVQKLCQEAERHVLKILRLSLEFGEEILESDHNVKILYLIRDPRPVMKSRFINSWCMADDCRNPEKVCSIHSEDLVQAVALRQTFPDRFLFVRYEDLSLNPEEEINSILTFLGETYSSETLGAVIDDFMSAKLKRKGKHTTKIDSRQHVFKWRNHLNFNDMSEIQNVCQSVMESVGYRIYPTEELYRNESISPLINIS